MTEDIVNLYFDMGTALRVKLSLHEAYMKMYKGAIALVKLASGDEIPINFKRVAFATPDELVV